MNQPDNFYETTGACLLVLNLPSTVRVDSLFRLMRQAPVSRVQENHSRVVKTKKLTTCDIFCLQNTERKLQMSHPRFFSFLFKFNKISHSNYSLPKYDFSVHGY